MTATAWPFVELNEQGLAFVQGTTTKVIEIALDQLSGMDAAEIHRQYPYLSLPKIHAALGYYHEHQEDCDRQIEERRQRAEEIRRMTENVPLQERLRKLSQR